MEPYQERVIAEKMELDEKIQKLDSFIKNPESSFSLLSEAERTRLIIQRYLMRRYSEILTARILFFKE